MSNHLQPLLRFFGSHREERCSPTTRVFLPCGVLHQKAKKNCILRPSLLSRRTYPFRLFFVSLFFFLCFKGRQQGPQTSDSIPSLFPDGRTMSLWKQPLTRAKWSFAEDRVNFLRSYATALSNIYRKRLFSLKPSLATQPNSGRLNTQKLSTWKLVQNFQIMLKTAHAIMATFLVVGANCFCSCTLKRLK